jgi:hypothetical protein
MDKLKTGSGKRLRTEALTETALPVPYDAAAMPGASVLGTDGQIYRSIKISGVYEWSKNVPSLETGEIFLGLDGPRTNFNYNIIAGGTNFVPLVQFEGGTPARSALAVTRFGSGTPLGPYLILAKTRSANALGDVAVIDGDVTGNILFMGSDGTEMIPGAGISAGVLGTPTPGSVPMQLNLRTRPAGATAGIPLAGRLRITPDGNVLINNTTGTERLDVTGNIKASGSLIGSTLSISGQSVRTTALQETTLPIALDATTMPGATVLGTDGRIYASIFSAAVNTYTWQFLLAASVDGQVLVNLAKAELGASFVTAATDGPLGGRPGRVAIMPSTGAEPGASIGSGGEPIGRLEFVSRSMIDAQSNIGRPVRIQANASVGWTETSKPADILFFASRVNPDPLILDVAPTIRYRIIHDGTHDFFGSTNNTALRINSNGNVLIGNTTGTERLSVTGKIQLTATGDSYMVGTNNVVGSRKTGWAAPTGTATRTAFDTATVAVADLAERVKALIDDLTSHGLIGA